MTTFSIKQTIRLCVCVVVVGWGLVFVGEADFGFPTFDFSNDTDLNVIDIILLCLGRNERRLRIQSAFSLCYNIEWLNCLGMFGFRFHAVLHSPTGWP
jgi:hypothetical protein